MAWCRHDAETLRRIRDHLQPGGALIFNCYAPYLRADHWQYWPAERRRSLPEDEAAPEPAQRSRDAAELGLSSRVVDVDPLAQVITLEIRARRWRDGRLEADERYTLKETLYFHHEVLLLLERPVSARCGWRATTRRPSRPRTRICGSSSRSSRPGRSGPTVGD